MRPVYRQLVTVTLLGLYGTISLLGHGLHWLSAEDHRHIGRQVVRCSDAGADHGHHHHHGHDHHGEHHHHDSAAANEAEDDATLGVASTDCAAHCHDCQVCALLLQVRSEQAKLDFKIVWQQVVSAAPAALQRSYSPISVGLHAPRGPPLGLS
jgi:hypothetical protein